MQFYYIIVRNDGFASAGHPYIHNKYGSALEEAKRLSSLHPSHTFTVYKSIVSISLPTSHIVIVYSEGDDNDTK